ncbi:hypothetical protein BST61_g8203 [Cercospora zeina]
MSYNVYTIERLSSGSLNHVVIFVETAKDAGGLIFHVTGDVLGGMVYEKISDERADISAAFTPGSRCLIGSIPKTKLAAFESTCESVPVPGAQLELNDTPEDLLKPIGQCGEWVEEVKAKLIADEILFVGSTEGKWLVLL